ncbi:MAG: right-handed parallel beta-helix repeat-containing protein, partial [Acidobacteriota bacterium]|nr:right-handed parallel beta-helix repeat-containing protein [Acidobacteriota bacterium]
MNSRERLAAFRLPAAFRFNRAVLVSLAACALLLLAGSNHSARAATIQVPAGGDLQAALDRAQPGDEVVLQAGAAYVGNFALPVKTGSSFITIRSSRCAELPAGVRVKPADAPAMARLATPNAMPVLVAPVRSHHWRLQCLEFTQGATVGEYGYSLVQLGDGSAAGSQKTLDTVPSHFEFDRVIIRARDERTAVHRGITLDSAHTTVRNSYIYDIKWNGVETQALGGTNGSGPFTIENNYLEAAGIQILFGGAPPAIPGLVPSDIRIRNNHFFKPLKWRQGDPAYAGRVWTVKNLIEFKNARRVLIEDNLLENSWPHAQIGWGIVINTGSDSGPANVVEDVTFVRNTLRNISNGINIRGMEANETATRTKRITIRDNVIERLGAYHAEGGKLFQLLNATDDVVIDHNTVRDSLVARSFLILEGVPAAKHARLVVTNNVGPFGLYGVLGAGGYFGTFAFEQHATAWTFSKNALLGTPPDQQARNAGNYFVASVEAAVKLLGTDGQPVGARTLATPAPTPAPTPVAPPKP